MKVTLKQMTKEEFEHIIEPLYLMRGRDCQDMRGKLLKNFDKWKELKNICNVTDCG